MLRTPRTALRALLLVIGLALLASLAGFLAQRLATDAPPLAGDPGPRRIVSLSPAVTETLEAMGAQQELVAVSDYCPTSLRSVERVGTSIAPSYEHIASLGPTLVLAEATVGTRIAPLRVLAPTLALPWLTVDDLVMSTRKLGQLAGHEREADLLATRLEHELRSSADVAAPEVLLLIGTASAATDQLWFIRPNSIHGAVLAAAGGRNAVVGAVRGPPNMSYEHLVELDPEIVISLELPGMGGVSLASIRRLDQLRAVRSGRVASLVDPAGLVPGPRILDLRDALAALLERLEARA